MARFYDIELHGVVLLALADYVHDPFGKGDPGVVSRSIIF